MKHSKEVFVKIAISILENIRTNLSHPEGQTIEQLLWNCRVVDSEIETALLYLQSCQERRREATDSVKNETQTKPRGTEGN